MNAPTNIESLAAARARKNLVRLGTFPSCLHVIEGEGASLCEHRTDLHVIAPHPDTRCAELVGED